MSDVDRTVLQENHARTQATLMPLVREACRRHPGARGDYRLLYEWVLHDYYGLPMRWIKRLRQCPSPEATCRSYRRCRDKWPDDCPPTQPTQLKRMKYASVYRQFFKQNYQPKNLTAFL